MVRILILSVREVMLFMHVFIVIIVLLICCILINRVVRKYYMHKNKKMTEIIINIFMSEQLLENNKFINRNKRLFFNKYIELSQTVILTKNSRKKVVDYIRSNYIYEYYIKRLRSNKKYKRIESVMYLSYVPCEKSRLNLEHCLTNEKDFTVKQYLCYALSNIGDPRSIESMVNSLIGSPNWYQERISTFLSEFGIKLYNYILKIRNRSESEVQKLIIRFAAIYTSESLKKHLLILSDSNDKELSHAAIKVLGNSYFEELNQDKYLKHENIEIVKLAIRSLSKINNRETIDKLIPFLLDDKIKNDAAYSISSIMKNEPVLISYIVNRFYLEKNIRIKQGLADVLSSKVEYFLLKLLSNERSRVKLLIKDILLLGKINGIIGFLNNNKNVEIENEILSVVKEVIPSNNKLKNEFSSYLSERMLNKINLRKSVPRKPTRDTEKEKDKNIMLYVGLFLLTITFPVIYVFRHHEILFTVSIINQIKKYIIDFNYYLIYYSCMINSLYIIILLFSFIGLFSQSLYWKVKQINLLFKKNVLPGISIIAPAFCEESTITESVNSLLNLQYPDYELIVVNDGSIDGTLNKLIDYYDLEKVDRVVCSELNTMPIRGVYTNKQISKLIVVDKANGGKADSINAGINISSKEMFCCIDADSLLEPDSLLKISSLSIDNSNETLAVGGNVFPINGCTISKGELLIIKLSKNTIAKFQTIEYLRAFMTGRIGWANLKSLLIISGAFGLFNKKRVIEIGGYLTKSERYKKDTVGEDMEIVVRLTKHMNEKNIKGSICYSYNANCWTEVPETITNLHRQRDRWQRGLIDIITYHKKVLFNPKYKQMGLISMPYFFIFEMIGPLIEFKGYVMVLLAVMIGILNLKIGLLLFITNVLLGIVVSLCSIIISQKDSDYYTLKEILTLISLAVVENFGFRQLMCVWRSCGYINSMKKPKGWGVMTRKGFTKD